MIKKILITGANGLLGANAAIALYRKGYDIRLMIRENADINVLSDLPSEIIIGSIDVYEDVQKAVQDCDAVVHAASVTAQWGVSKKVYEEVNVKGTQHVIDACIRAGVKKLVYISTANTLAPGTRDNPGNELGGFDLFYIDAPYINTKYVGQQKVLESTAAKKLNAVVINPTFMLGAYDSKPSSGQIVQYALGKKILFYPPGGKNFVHVNSVCDCIAASLENEVNGECFLAAGENLSYKVFFKKLNNISAQKPMMIKIPSPLLKLAGLLGSFIGRVTGKRVQLNYASARLLCLNTYYSNNKSKDYFGIHYKSVDVAIKDAVDWFRNR